MSRKNRHGKQQQAVVRYRVSLAYWQRFQRFVDAIPQLEEALADLQTSWCQYEDYLATEFHLTAEDFEDIEDVVQHVIDLFAQTSRGGLRKNIKKSTAYWPKPTDMRVAEIIIEEIDCDGKL